MNVNRVRHQASQYLDYDMIQQYTKLPSFPGYQTQLLLSFLRPELQLDGRSELYALVTSLVQVGIDAHDMIGAEDRTLSIREMRSKQLAILAGDYLSGRYYELLSAAGDIDAVGVLSDAISEVNILKMNLYMRKKQRDLSGEQYLEQLLAIRTRLFLAFEACIPASDRTLWRDLLESGTRCQIIQSELDSLTQLREDYDGWAVWELFDVIERDELRAYVDSLDNSQELAGWLDRHDVRERLEHLAARSFDRFDMIANSDPNHVYLVDQIRPHLQDIRKYKKTLTTYE